MTNPDATTCPHCGSSSTYTILDAYDALYGHGEASAGTALEMAITTAPEGATDEAILWEAVTEWMCVVPTALIAAARHRMTEMAYIEAQAIEQSKDKTRPQVLRRSYRLELMRERWAASASASVPTADLTPGSVGALRAERDVLRTVATKAHTLLSHIHEFGWENPAFWGESFAALETALQNIDTTTWEVTDAPA